MEEILLFIEERQTWIYLIFALIGLIYLRALILSYQNLRKSFFSLERERAMSRLSRSAAMLALVVAGLVATFVLANFAGPAVPASMRSTPLPTVSLLATPKSQSEAVEEGFATVTPLAPPGLNGAGCLNPDATILEPENGDTVSGRVQILGVANIQNFAFYKVEYRRLDGDWLTVSAGSMPVCETCENIEELGIWDTRLVEPGIYGFRLLVTDTAGNAPLPCEIQIQIMPSQ
ncbi:MAG: hypothetical protein GTO14_18130 [Anaerolineales bacterium]|nr:hypothetical protein [Anaerolineales bacterium]